MSQPPCKSGRRDLIASGPRACVSRRRTSFGQSGLRRQPRSDRRASEFAAAERRPVMFLVLGRRCYRPEFPSWRSPGLIYEELVGDKGVGCEGNGSLRSEPLFTQQRLACVAAADLHTCSAYRRLVSRDRGAAPPPGLPQVVVVVEGGRGESWLGSARVSSRRAKAGGAGGSTREGDATRPVRRRIENL